MVCEPVRLCAFATCPARHSWQVLGESAALLHMFLKRDVVQCGLIRA